MEYKLITSNKFTTSVWTGGTTTQLFIFPPETSYNERNFQFRLSTATVETNESTFTSLPGISRKLMILEGKITIIHEDHYSKQLNRFDVDSFEGDWKTSAIGTCTDFNLMMNGNQSGDLKSIEIDKGHSCLYNMKKNANWVCLYVYSGNVTTRINHETIILDNRDLLVLKKPDHSTLLIESKGNSVLVMVEIN